MISTFHQGEFIKAILTDRHIKFASVAKAMGVGPQSFLDYFKSQTISETVLLKMSDALKFDIHGMVQDEMARRMGPLKLAQGNSSMVSEPIAPYERRRAPGAKTGSAYDIVLHMEEFDPVAQLQILKFIQVQREKASSSATGS